MKNDMKLILERWDKYAILENTNLEKIKDNEKSSEQLLGKTLETSNKKELQSFAKILLSDQEIKDASEKLLQFLQLVKKESGNTSVKTEMEEGILDDVGLNLYSASQKFANSELGQVVSKYGAGTLTLAAAVLFALGKIDADTASSTMGLGVAMKAKDSQEVIASIADIAGNLV